MLEYNICYPLSGFILIVGAVISLKWFDFIASQTIRRLIDKADGKTI
jgi:hypothetical protein